MKTAEEKATLGLTETMVRLVAIMVMTPFIVYFNLLFVLPVQVYLVVTICIDFCPVKYFLVKLFNRVPKLELNKTNKHSNVSHAH